MKNKIVFSTHPDFRVEEKHTEQETILPSAQTLYLELQRHGGGKVVTIVQNFIGKTEDLEALGKWLKSRCGVGGSVKDGLILIQGNKRDQVNEILKKLGYKTKLKGG